MKKSKTTIIFMILISLGILFVSSQLTIAQTTDQPTPPDPQQAAPTGTKFVSDNPTGGDCSSIGIWNSSTKTCTLTQDVFETIQIDSDNITLDGNNYTITGNNTGSGIYLSGRTGITIKNLTIKNFYAGIYLGHYSNNNTIANSNLLNNSLGVYLYYQSNNNTLTNNNISNNWSGIYLYNSHNTTLFANTFSNNDAGVYLNSASGNNFLSNTINNNSNSAISLQFSWNNNFLNNLLSNNFRGIDALNSSTNTFTGNNISNNVSQGIQAFSISSNTFTNNNFSNNSTGISLNFSGNNIFTDNSISFSNQYGVYFFGAQFNTLQDNNISDNQYGVYFTAVGTNNNQIYHNNFVNNTIQAFVSLESPGNLFNLPPPQGGNYWSNFDEISESCNDTNIDKICDSPYVFTGGQDNYPWTIQNGWLAPQNQPPTLSNLQQLKSDNQTQIQENGITQESTIIFKSTLQDPDNDQVKLQVELKEKDRQFDGTNLIESSFVASNITASITRYGLIPGSYHWRTRAVDNQGNTSNWREFGISGNIDFTIGRTIKVAVILAEPFDKSFDSSHTKFYFDNVIAPQVKDYYCEVSFGKRGNQGNCQDGLVNLDFEVFDNNGVPYKLSQNQQYYGEAGLFNVEITVTDANQQSITVSEPDRTLEFIWDAINKADTQSNLNYNLYESVIVVYSGESQTYDPPLEAFRTKDFMRDIEVDLSFAPLASPNEQAKNWIAVAEQDLIGPWAHEIGHALGKLVANQTLCELYESFRSCGEVDLWDVMGTGWKLGNPKGSKPSYLSSYSKQKLGWLSSEFENLSYGTHFINALVKQNFGDKINRYNLSDTSYYLLEARTKDLLYSRWDTALPNDALVVYKVTKESPQSKESINLVKAIGIGSIPLSPLTNLFDPFTNTLIDAKNFIYDPPTFKIEAGIQPFSLSEYVGMTLEPASVIWNSLPEPGVISQKEPSKLTQIATNQYPYDKVAPEQIIFDESGLLPRSLKYNIFYPVLFYAAIILIVAYLLASNLKDEKRKKIKKLIIILSIIFLIVWILFRGLIFLLEKRYIMIQRVPNDTHASLISALNTINSSPDLDLHAITPDGKHTGVNYQTGGYENQIPNAIASGDLVYDDEWIFVPDGTMVKYYVSSYDVEQFLNENPDIAQQLPSTQETYTLSAMYYDSQSKKYESTPLPDQPINPGQTIIHQTQGTTDISVSQGIPDTTSPQTTISLFGSQGLNNWFISDVQITLSAIDDIAGLHKTEYSLDNGTTWTTYALPFAISKEGIHTLFYRSQDLVGNLEQAKTQEIKIDKTAPESEIFFNPSTQQLEVEGTDNTTVHPSITSIEDDENEDEDEDKNEDDKEKEDIIYQIQDEAGNITKLYFDKIKQHGKEIKAELESLQYNGEPIIELPETELKYEWSLDKNGDMKELEQRIKVEDGFNVKAKYNRQQNKTKIKIKQKDQEEIEQTLPGLIIIKLITELGVLSFSY